MIKAINKYVYKNKEYHSLNEIKEEIHNTIGLTLLDEMQRKCPLNKHKDYINLLNLICSKKIRTVLVDCLTTNYVEFDQYEETETIKNILDL